MSERKLRSIEADQSPVLVDDLVEFAKLYEVDIRELIYESYVEEGEEQILGKRYASILKLLDQLSDKDLEDFIWIVKQRIAGKI